MKRSKKLCALLLVLTMLMLMPACGTSALAAESDTAKPGQLMAGASRKDITPQPDMFPIAWSTNGTFVGVIENINVRVLALNDGNETSLILNYETGKGPYPPEFLPLIAEATGVPEENIFWSTTHDHSAPEIKTSVLDEDSNLGKWGRYVLDQVIAGAQEAIENMVPVGVGIGYTESAINVNRTYNIYDMDIQGFNSSGPSDKTLAVIAFNSVETGEPVAFILHYAMHNIGTFENDYFADQYEGILYDADEKYSDEGVMGVHPDISGKVCQYIEQTFDGAVSLWLSGAAGDQNPIFMAMGMHALYTGAAITYSLHPGVLLETTDALARIQFTDALRAIESIDSFETEVAVSHNFGETDLPGKEGYDDVTIQLELMRIGDIALVGCAGELYNSIGVYMQEHSLLENTLVVNHCWRNADQILGYLGDDDAVINGTYNFPINAEGREYQPGYINEYLTELMNGLIAETENGK